MKPEKPATRAGKGDDVQTEGAFVVGDSGSEVVGSDRYGRGVVSRPVAIAARKADDPVARLFSDRVNKLIDARLDRKLLHHRLLGGLRGDYDGFYKKGHFAPNECGGLFPSLRQGRSGSKPPAVSVPPGETRNEPLLSVEGPS
jgi:hypothetical protein